MGEETCSFLLFHCLHTTQCAPRSQLLCCCSQRCSTLSCLLCFLYAYNHALYSPANAVKLIAHNGFPALKSCFFNCRSIVNKLDLFRIFLETEKPDIVLLVETWLHSQIHSSFLYGNLPYNIVRKDRNSKGGGVAILLRDHLTYSIVPTTPSIEILCIDLLISTSFIRVIAGYRPPSLITTKTQLFCDTVSDLSSCTSNPVIFIGDVNCDSLTPPVSPSDRLLQSLVADLDLSHCHLLPTRLLRSIDWLCTTHTTLVHNTTIIPGLATSDHLGISFTITSHLLPPAQSMTRDFSRTDYDAMNAYLSQIDWLSLFSDFTDIDDMYTRFCNVVYHAIDSFVPYRTPRSNTMAYPPHIQRIIKRRNILFSSLDTSPAAHDQYSAISTKLTREIKKWNRFCEHKKLLRSKELFSHISKLTKSKTTIPPSLSRPDGSLATSTVDKVNLLAHHFSSVYTTTSSDNNLPPLYSHPLPCRLTSFTFYPFDVRKALNKLKPSGSTGADNIPQIIFNKCSSSLSLPLADIYNWSMRLGQVPSVWKHSLITPLLKPSKDPLQPSSYRPISILSPACKSMERIIKDKLLPYLIKYDIYAHRQHGFRPNASVLTNMIDCENTWTSALSKKHIVDIIYIDFEKAFDTVCHKLLIHKCSHYGLPPSLVHWLDSYLSNRTFSVRMNNILSDPQSVLSGVPQGSVLGPILYCVYTSDISRMLTTFSHVHCQEYADDLKLFVTYDPKNPGCAPTQLQQSLDALTQWSSHNHLRISFTKCSHMRLGSTSSHNLASYSIDSIPLNTLGQVRDLGLQVVPSLRKHASVVDRQNKAKYAMYSMLRAVSVNCPILLTKCFKIYVLPHLDFGCSFYSPYLSKDIQAIESIQRTFTRIVYFRCFPSPSYPQSLPSYHERLVKLGLHDLNDRRKVFDLKLAYSIMQGVTILNRSDFFKFTPSRNRSGTFRVHIDFSKNTGRYNSFPLRVARLFNTLPANILQATNRNTFASRVWKHITLTDDTPH